MQRSRGPEIVATVFKLLAFLELCGCTVGALTEAISLPRRTTLSSNAIAGIIVGIVISGIVVAAALAFFGYVLELLIEIRDNAEIVAEMSLLEDDEPEGAD